LIILINGVETLSTPVLKKIKKIMFIDDERVLNNKNLVLKIFKTVFRQNLKNSYVLLDNNLNRDNIKKLLSSNKVHNLEKGYDLKKMKTPGIRENISFWVKGAKQGQKALQVIDYIKRKHEEEKFIICADTLVIPKLRQNPEIKERSVKITRTGNIINLIEKIKAIVIFAEDIDPDVLIGFLSSGCIVFAEATINENNILVKNKTYIELPDNEYLIANKIIQVLSEQKKIENIVNETKKIIRKYSWEEVYKRSLKLIESI